MDFGRRNVSRQNGFRCFSRFERGRLTAMTTTFAGGRWPAALAAVLVVACSLPSQAQPGRGYGDRRFGGGGDSGERREGGDRRYGGDRGAGGGPGNDRGP